MIQSVKDLVVDPKERKFLKAVRQGLADIAEGRTVGLAEAKKRLGLI